MNPIITRELVSMLRTRRAFIWQAAVVIALSLLVVMRWPTDAKVQTSGQEAKAVLRVFGYGLMIAVVMLAPVFPATSIVRERQRGTLALLLNSPMGPWSILTGKLISSMGFILLLMLLSLPPAAATFTMGGVDLAQVLLVYALALLATLQYGSIALYISSSAMSIDAALRITFGVVIFLAAVPLVLSQFIPKEQPMPYGPMEFISYLTNVPTWADKQEFAWLPAGLAGPVYQVILYVVISLTYISRFFSPAPAMTAILQDEAVLDVAGGAVWRYAIFAVVSALFFMFLTAGKLAPGMLDRSKAAGKVTNERSAAVKAYRRFMFLWFFDPQRRSGMIGRLSNPIMVKEFRTRKFGRSHWLMRLFALCIVLSLGLMFATTAKTEGRVENVRSILVILQVSLLLLLTPALAAGLISSERESGGWTLLQMTPQSAVSIVFGKLMSVFLTLLMVLLATMPAYFVILFIDAPDATEAGTLPMPLILLEKAWFIITNSPQTPLIMGIVGSLLLMSLFALLLSAAMSSLFRRTSTATAVSYAVLGVICVGTILVRFAEDAPFSHGMVETVLALNPLAAILTQIRAPMFTDYPSVAGANRWIMIAGSALCLGLLVWRTRQLTRPQ